MKKNCRRKERLTCCVWLLLWLSVPLTQKHTFAVFDARQSSSGDNHVVFISRCQKCKEKQNKNNFYRFFFAFVRFVDRKLISNATNSHPIKINGKSEFSRNVNSRKWTRNEQQTEEKNVETEENEQTSKMDDSYGATLEIISFWFALLNDINSHFLVDHFAWTWTTHLPKSFSLLVSVSVSVFSLCEDEHVQLSCGHHHLLPSNFCHSIFSLR